MLTCPMCKKTVRGLPKECPTCRTDLTILVDYLSDLDGNLQRAEELTRSGKLGEAVWAYLEVLEVDPDNPMARKQVGSVATAVRQFDELTPGRGWAARIRKRASVRNWVEDVTDLRDEVTPAAWKLFFIVGVMLLATMVFGFGWGYQAAQPRIDEPAAGSTGRSTQPSAKPTTPREKGKLPDKGPPPLGK